LQAPTPSSHWNFDKPKGVFRGPYEYSVPGHDADYLPQNEKLEGEPKTEDAPDAQPAPAQ